MSMNQVFVENVSWSATEDDLRNAFETEGFLVERAKIAVDDDGRSRGFGFITLGNGQNVNNVVDRMTGYILEGRVIKVEQANGAKKRTPQTA